jgi:hypothetical protein
MDRDDSFPHKWAAMPSHHIAPLLPRGQAYNVLTGPCFESGRLGKSYVVSVVICSYKASSAFL